MNDIKILIATHKDYVYPQDNMYYPIQLGVEQSIKKFNILLDNKDINISSKNKNYCELTALYWAWKNNFFKNCDYCGLVHYRRYFIGKGVFLKNKILSQQEIKQYMKDYDVILPKKYKVDSKNIYLHYARDHYKKDLDLAIQIIINKYPEYKNSLKLLTDSKKIYLYNMFVIKNEFFEEYCEWLFSILFELETEIDISEYSSYQARVFGFLSERLFNVWIDYKKLKIKEIRVINIESDNSLLTRIKRKLLSYIKLV